ncbi:MAG TPA: zinc-binding dehydrogenase [Candidatus Methylomirabilis sp.]|nr:zinc-binding dehydrogenase [Candidatus Methylomirabilis sp.]HSC70709.1 zinc-binding dehydrogenase [Candidatus Methylomirabilis sp.]
MRAIQLHQPGGPDQLRYQEVPTPRPGPGEVLVQLKAAALNHRDVWIRLGRQMADRLPLIPGSDGAGLVAEVGAGVTQLQVGSPVVVNPSLDWGDREDRPSPAFRILGGPDPGTYAEYIVIPAANVFPKPSPLSFEEAAAMPLASLTAWRAVITRGQVRPGERVVILGIGGGVATFALQIARQAGASVIATSSSDMKLQRASELGADLAINYTSTDWAQLVLDHTGGGADVVIDSVGKATWEQALRALRPGGRLVSFGATTGPTTEVNIRAIFWNHISILGTTMGSPREFAAMLPLYDAGRVKPVVDRVYSLRDAAEAHRRMDAAEQFGKLVLIP